MEETQAASRTLQETAGPAFLRSWGFVVETREHEAGSAGCQPGENRDPHCSGRPSHAGAGASPGPLAAPALLWRGLPGSQVCGCPHAPSDWRSLAQPVLGAAAAQAGSRDVCEAPRVGAVCVGGVRTSAPHAGTRPAPATATVRAEAGAWAAGHVLGRFKAGPTETRGTRPASHPEPSSTSGVGWGGSAP